MPDTHKPLVFLHLSDIHFEASIAGGPDDLDGGVRRKLEAELTEQVGKLGQATGILISGDIASRGQPLDYDYARRWLDSVCAKLGIETHCVWTVPGNHDVDQSAQRENHTATLTRRSLLAVDFKDLDEEIRAVHAEDALRDSLYAPLTNYNNFAGAYDSAVDGVNWRWWDAEFPLNDGSSLVVRGVNSALVSDKDDNTRKVLIVGTAALTMTDEPGRLLILMCHHPPHWLRDRPTIDGAVGRRACLQLFGHEHDQAVVRINNTVRVASGALHPERKGENWRPQYNIISLRIARGEKGRTLHLEIRSRAWSRQLACFIADDGVDDGHYRFEIPLVDWVSPDPVAPTVVAETAAAKSGDKAGGDMNTQEPDRPVDAAITRRLSHRFHRLPIPDQWKIVKELKYLELQYSTTSVAALFMAVFQRARSERRLAELWRYVENEYGTPQSVPNPFDDR